MLVNIIIREAELLMQNTSSGVHSSKLGVYLYVDRSSRNVYVQMRSSELWHETL